jgi:peroxiredoxin
LLARLCDGQVDAVPAAEAIGGGRTLVIGLPGAFTPVCSRQHAPAMIANADQMRQAGFDRVICIVANDPFVTDAWAQSIDLEHKVTFLSDGNLAFAGAFGLITAAPELFMGRCSERYLMIVDKGRVASCKVESCITDYSCTNPNLLFLADA